MLLLSMYLEIIRVYCICLVGALYNNVHVGECISSQLCTQWCHFGSSKSAIVGIFPPQKSATDTDQDLIGFFHELSRLKKIMVKMLIIQMKPKSLLL